MLLGESENTVKQHLSDFGILIRSTYAKITDNALDEVILKILLDFPITKE